MSDFDHLKTQFETAPKAPLQLSCLMAPCDQCGHQTGTKILFMQAGYGNACAVCGRLRRGKPYLSKAEFNALKPAEAKGETDEAEAV